MPADAAEVGVAESTESAVLVPLGKVPLRTIVLLPSTLLMATRDLSRAFSSVPLGMTDCRKVLLLLLSHPH